MFYIVEFVVFTLLQISVFRMLPDKLKDWLVCYPIPIFLINMAGSFMILDFAGQTHGAGAVNMMASCAFGLYIWFYRKVYDVQKTEDVVTIFGIKVKYTTCKRMRDIQKDEKSKTFYQTEEGRKTKAYEQWFENMSKYEI